MAQSIPCLLWGKSEHYLRVLQLPPLAHVTRAFVTSLPLSGVALIVVPVVWQSHTPFVSGPIVLCERVVPVIVGGLGMSGYASATMEIPVGPSDATGVFGEEKNGG